MDKILFIINPIAGAGKAKSIIPIIEIKMKENNIGYEIILTKEPRDAIKIAGDNVDKFSTIVAVGGDGTVNEVAKGLINSRKGTLAIIPCGTGNDFSRTLGLPMDPIKAIDVIIKKNIRVVDIGKINGNNFLNIASVGFDTEVVIHTNSIKKKVKSKIAYILGVLATLFDYKKREVSLVIDGVTFERNLVLLAVGNGNFYGGGLQILPMSEVDDGYFHICLVKDISNFKILFLFPSIFKGKHLKYKKYVEIFKAKEVIVKNTKKININIDGEIIAIGNDVIFEIEDYKLNVITS